MTPPRTGYDVLDAVREQPGSVLAFAHRGGAGHPEVEGLENTLAAFRHAYSLGYRYLETDVHASADGMVMAFHDAALERLTGRSGTLAEHDAAQLREALIGGAEEIPTMASLLEELPEARFNIDLKSDATVRPLVELLARARAHDRVLVGSFAARRVRAFRRLTGGRVATAAHPAEVVAVRLLPGVAAARLLTGSPVALQVPHRRGPVAVVTRGLVQRAHALGIHVHVWTVDRPDEMTELLDLGVDGLFTDRTDVLREVLRARGQWWEPR